MLHKIQAKDCIIRPRPEGIAVMFSDSEDNRFWQHMPLFLE